MDEYTKLISSAPLVMVEFYATWCPHCQRMMPVVAEIRELVGDSAPIYQLDIDENGEAAEKRALRELRPSSSTATGSLYGTLPENSTAMSCYRNCSLS